MPGRSAYPTIRQSQFVVGGTQIKDGDYIFGFPDEWAKFQERFPAFLKALDALAETIQKVKVRTFTPQRHPADLTVFFLRSLVFEDFKAVGLLAERRSPLRSRLQVCYCGATRRLCQSS